MAANGNNRGGLLTAGGILSIIAGAFEVIGGVIMVVLTIRAEILLRLPIMPFHPGGWFEHYIPVTPFWLIIVGMPLLVLGIIAIVGGVSALRRKNFGLSLAGAICALIPLNLLGLLAVIFVSLGKREFEAED
jgi:hypothetical protein